MLISVRRKRFCKKPMFETAADQGSAEAWLMSRFLQHAGNVIVRRGLYIITVLHHERGRNNGAQLSHIRRGGEKPIPLSQAHFEMLDGTPYFERR
jgi:hypothetical protein